MSNFLQPPESADQTEVKGDLNNALNTFTENLKKVFDSTLHEPIPEVFMDLLERLDDAWEGPDK